MYARLTTVELGASEDVAILASTLFEQVRPVVEALPGFRGMSLLSEVDGQQLGALTLWENEEALRNAEPTLEKIKRAETAHRNVVNGETRRYQISGCVLK